MPFNPTRLDAAASPLAPHGPRPHSALALRLIRGHADQRTRTITPPVFLLGGADDCDLVLAAPEFPDAYAYIYTGPRVTIRWLGEGPQLHVAGRPVEQAVLKDGALLEFGPFALRFVIEPATPSGPDGLPESYPEKSNTLPVWRVAEEQARSEVRALLAAIRDALDSERAARHARAPAAPLAHPPQSPQSAPSDYPTILSYTARLRSA